jgi:hypothetical protein
MKKINFIVALLLLLTSVKAQIKLPIKLVASPAALQQIVSGLDNNFETIKGDAINTAPQQIDYSSKIQWPDALSCFITQYSKTEKKNTTSNSSFQVTFKESESYKDAIKLFKKSYNQINGATLRYKGKSIKLTADYETPDENVGFSTIMLESKEDSRLQVLLELTNDNLQWQVKINVFELVQIK